LTKDALQVAEEAGAAIVVVLGDPGFYGRLGFRLASRTESNHPWSSAPSLHASLCLSAYDKQLRRSSSIHRSHRHRHTLNRTAGAPRGGPDRRFGRGTALGGLPPREGADERRRTNVRSSSSSRVIFDRPSMPEVVARFGQLGLLSSENGSLRPRFLTRFWTRRWCPVSVVLVLLADRRASGEDLALPGRWLRAASTLAWSASMRSTTGAARPCLAVSDRSSRPGVCDRLSLFDALAEMSE